MWLSLQVISTCDLTQVCNHMTDALRTVIVVIGQLSLG